MQTLIYRKPIFRFHRHLPIYDPQKHQNHDYLIIHPKRRHYHPLKTPNLCSPASPQSLSYGGWDDLQLIGDSDQSGESNQFRNFLSSSGIGDKKYVFVYLFGFVCALAISRVKVSTIIVFPACAIVFALGFSAGWVKGDDTFRGLVEKLSNLEENLGGCNAEILNVKNGIRRSIEHNQVTVTDLEGYIDVIESADVSLQSTLDVVRSCIQSIVLGGNESGRKRKKSGENGFNFSRYLSSLIGRNFDGPKPASAVKDRNSENENKSMSGSPFDSTVRAQDRVEYFADETETENVSLENETDFDQTIYNYKNKTSKLVNEQAYLEDFDDDIETMSSQNDSYSSVDVSISMNRIKTANRNYSRIEKMEESQHESRRYFRKKGPKKRPSSANQEFEPENILGDDLEFNRYIAEANNLFKEAKGYFRQKIVDGRVEHALHKSAALLSKAIEMRPMSLLAVGQLGNTYLLHGELKLRTSRELRSLLVRSDDPLPAGKDKISSSLIDVCEECEELLMKAGRKYKMALSIDASDMRALYNWGLALSFRGQLISDIGPSAARDADKVFLAAIDKFDAMMSKSNAYAPDALFRWGTALQHRSRLRPSRSPEKVKLLQQARRLYEDALDMDSGNIQLQKALSSCVSELRYIT
ncbi:hypothetical protein MIMGU_mgv1a002765mg [Erythranthe guttata]|uniref:Uncharacterized protein n=1 Tax=Erythranthe guttata TaxID=4155 RepID=A0A022QKZ6_ERYGU|nr:hypothetical protein MIMGU_mgv1a002765mg [Erythranthe guttata]